MIPLPSGDNTVQADADRLVTGDDAAVELHRSLPPERREAAMRELERRAAARTPEERRAVFCRDLQVSGSVAESARIAGVSTTTIYYWAKGHPEVAAALELHREIMRQAAMDWMDEVIAGRAKCYSHEQSGLAIYRASGGKQGAGKGITVRVVWEDGSKRQGVEIELPPGGEGGSSQ